jgi:hypothetical protein
MYDDTIGENNVTRMYMFDNQDKLFGVMLVFKVAPEDETTFRNLFIKNYNNLTQKYRDADKYYDEDLSKRGLSAEWDFRSSIILLQFQLKRPINRLALGLLYLNKKYASAYMEGKPLDKY